MGSISTAPTTEPSSKSDAIPRILGYNLIYILAHYITNVSSDLPADS